MKLIVLKNNEPLTEYSLKEEDIQDVVEIYVGRSKDCHLYLEDPLISRHHFLIEKKSGNWNIKKITKNGSISVNGQNIVESSLKNNDEIRFGPYVIIINQLSGSVPISTDIVKNVEPHRDVMSEEKQNDKIEVVSNISDDSSESQKVESIHDQDEVFVSASDGALHHDSSDIEPKNLDDVSSFENQEENNFLSNDLIAESDFSNNEPQDYDGLADEQNNNESTRVLKSFVNYSLLIFGNAPYDRFILDSEETFIGRNPEKCQILLDDPEVSSVHAVVRRKFAEITLEDLNSSNGTLLMGERINKATLNVGDEFVIGSTSFTLEAKSDILESESDRLMPVEQGQVLETQEFVDQSLDSEESVASFSSSTTEERSILKRIWKDPVKRKKVIYGLVLFSIILLFLPEDEKEPNPPLKNDKASEKIQEQDQPGKIKLSKEQENKRNVSYDLGVGYFEQNRYDLAQVEFQTVVTIDPNYKNVQAYLEQTNNGLKQLQEAEAKRREEEDRIRFKVFIDELLAKAREAVANKNVELAENLFSQITEKDPENIEVSQLKLELDAWVKEQERLALEKAANEAKRKKMVDLLMPGKTFYLKREWYKSILKLEEFLRMKNLDEDLIKEASQMLGDAKIQLNSEVEPLLTKARSLKEGQDLKMSYEAYLDLLKIEPSNTEALSELDDIRFQLESRSKKIYREAIIAESLSLFNDAKEKFQEVQQISPTDSEYYKKASEKLKNYLE